MNDDFLTGFRVAKDTIESTAAAQSELARKTRTN
jgi:hypothetical protein